MSGKEAKPAAESSEAPPPKSKKLLIIIIAAVFLLVVAGAAAVFLIKSKKHADENGDEEGVTETSMAKKSEKKKDAHPPVFVNLEPFTVNLVQETGDQYLQLSISVEFEDPVAEQSMKANMPRIRNAITMLLSGKKASELAPKEGKEQLAIELKDAVNLVLEPSAAEPPKKGKKKQVEVEGPAKAVLFTAFIIQ